MDGTQKNDGAQVHTDGYRANCRADVAFLWAGAVSKQMSELQTLAAPQGFKAISCNMTRLKTIPAANHGGCRLQARVVI